MKRKWIVGLGALALAGVAAVAAVEWGWDRFDGRINALGVDLARPVAYVATSSLAALPRDLVKAPLLREWLTEDFAFYYEEHEDRLGVVGALRRIAFEHQPTLADNLLELALGEPAEVALWTDSRGAARHWAIAMTRGAVARALQGLAAVAAKDRQLTVIGELKAAGPGWSAQPVYALQLSARRTLALAARGNRVVVLSDPGLLFDAARQPDARAAQVLGRLLSGDAADQALWRRHFGVAPPAARGHTLVAGGTLLALGYAHFLPTLPALRVDVAAGGAALHSFVRQRAPGDGDAAPGAPSAASATTGAHGAAPQRATAVPWPALPAQAAACALLPVDWARVGGVLDVAAAAAGAAPPAALRAMAEAFDGNAAVCWYARSQLHTPLLVAHAKGPAPAPALVAEFARWWLPRTADVEATDPAPGAQARIAAPYGPLRDGDARAYAARFVRAGDWWLFSPDSELVEQAQATVARRYPSVLDTLGDPARTLALVAPREVAALLRREALAVLPPQQAVLHQAAQTLLLPRLDAFAALPRARASLRGAPDAQGWQALDWVPLQ